MLFFGCCISFLLFTFLKVHHERERNLRRGAPLQLWHQPRIIIIAAQIKMPAPSTLYYETFTNKRDNDIVEIVHFSCDMGSFFLFTSDNANLLIFVPLKIGQWTFPNLPTWSVGMSLGYSLFVGNFVLHFFVCLLEIHKTRPFGGDVPWWCFWYWTPRTKNKGEFMCHICLLMTV